MSINLGMVRPGSTIQIPFNTFDSNDPSASVAIAALVAGDIEVYKDGSVTQRASDSGYTLLDTDGIDFDGHVGIGGFSIDLADNDTAGFWASGSRYFVVLGPVTVDAAVVNFIAATFEIGYPDAILNTTIASLTSATQFILTDGPAEADVFIGCSVTLHDVASKVQIAFGVVSDYIVSTKELILAATPVGFTPVATDNVAIFVPTNVTAWNNVLLATTNPFDAIATTADLLDKLGAVDEAAAAGDPSSTESVMQYMKQLVNVLVGSAGIAAFPAEQAPANAINLAEVMRAIHTVTAKFAFTVANVVDANALRIDGDVDAAKQLRDNLDTTERFIVHNGFTPTTTQCQPDAVFFGDTAGTLEATDDHYNGRIMLFLTGVLQGQATDITDYDGTNKRFTYTALTEAPGNNDEFVVI